MIAVSIVIFIIILLLIVIFWQISTLISIYGGIFYVGSTPDVFRAAFRLAKLKKGKIFYELGSGLGDGLFIASREFGVNATGIEISPFFYLVSCLRTSGNKNIKIIWANFRKINLSRADVVYCYLLPKLMNELLVKFSQELKSGAVVVSYAFPIRQKTAAKIIEIKATKIYLYKF